MLHIDETKEVILKDVPITSFFRRISAYQELFDVQEHASLAVYVVGDFYDKYGNAVQLHDKWYIISLAESKRYWISILVLHSFRRYYPTDEIIMGVRILHA